VLKLIANKLVTAIVTEKANRIQAKTNLT